MNRQIQQRINSYRTRHRYALTSSIFSPHPYEHKRRRDRSRSSRPELGPAFLDIIQCARHATHGIHLRVSFRSDNRLHPRHDGIFHAQGQARRTYLSPTIGEIRLSLALNRQRGPEIRSRVGGNRIYRHAIHDEGLSPIGRLRRLGRAHFG